MKIRVKAAALLSTALLAGNAVAQAPAVPADLNVSEGPAYQMAAVVDRARGNVVLAGNYQEAIEALAGSDRKRFASRTNLCVAYTLSGELGKAGVECDAALRVSEGQVESASALQRKAARRDLALALSNMGVVKAVSGDLSAARAHFARAVEMGADIRQADANLQKLQAANGSEV